MDYAATTWATLEELREVGPLVHNITNYVAMDVTANALLAVGASPLMAHAPDEVIDIVGIAGALAVNIGTLERAWVDAMHLAAAEAVRLRKPWVLDPVGVGATPYRNVTAEARDGLLRGLIGRAPARRAGSECPGPRYHGRGERTRAGARPVPAR